MTIKDRILLFDALSRILINQRNISNALKIRYNEEYTDRMIDRLYDKADELDKVLKEKEQTNE